jgi:hypothetical protein
MGIVIVVVVVAAALIAVIVAASSRRTYDQIGHGGLSLRDGSDGGDGFAHEPRLSGPAAAREREDEIRQMLEARNELRARRGRAPLDVEAELRALSAPAGAGDPGLEAEIRDLVIARNERRVRRGLEPLDVDAEVARRLGELGGA